MGRRCHQTAVVMAGDSCPFPGLVSVKFQILCKDLGFEEVPGNNTWELDGGRVSTAGGGSTEGGSGEGMENYISTYSIRQPQMRAYESGTSYLEF